MKQAAHHSYSPIDDATNLRINPPVLQTRRDRQSTIAKARVACFCSALLLLFLVVISLKKLHTISHIRKQHLENNWSKLDTVHLGYPSPCDFNEENYQYIQVKDYTMKGQQYPGGTNLVVNEIILKRSSDSDDEQSPPMKSQFVHTYSLTNHLTHDRSRKTEWIFVNNAKLKRHFQTHQVAGGGGGSGSPHRITSNIWKTTYATTALSDNFNIPSQSLMSAVEQYFRIIHSFGSILYMEPMAVYATVSSTTMEEDISSPTRDRLVYSVAYSSIDSTLYAGINTATKMRCFERIELAHAYIIGPKNQILGILAMADTVQLISSLSRCNSKGTVDFAEIVQVKFPIIVHQMFKASPIFLSNCSFY